MAQHTSSAQNEPHARRGSASVTVRSLLAGRVAEHGVVITGFFVVVVAVAGASSIALLVWPSHSDTYFSWDLGTPPAAATIGGLYLASVVVFAVALTRPRPETRSLSFPQAIAWVILFLTAPISIGCDLRATTRTDTSPPARPTSRIALWVIAVSGGGLAIALWSEAPGDTVSAHSPIPVVGLTGHYIGAWCAFIAVSAATAAIRGRTGDARLVAVLLGSVSTGILAGAARSAVDLGPNVDIYVAALLGIAILAMALHRSNRMPTTQAIEPATPPDDRLMARADSRTTETGPS